MPNMNSRMERFHLLLPLHVVSMCYFAACGDASKIDIEAGKSVSYESTVEATCENTCRYANDGECDDGGLASEYSVCAEGTDCADCGPRQDLGASCESNDDCGDGQICGEGPCYCPPGMMCIQQMCNICVEASEPVDLGCQGDTDCGAAEMCIAVPCPCDGEFCPTVVCGECVGAEPCMQEGDCLEGQECVLPQIPPCFEPPCPTPAMTGYCRDLTESTPWPTPEPGHGEGEMCGGIAGFMCRSDLVCCMGDMAGVADGAGTCEHSCEETPHELCLNTGGEWDAGSCGHYICGQHPKCRALIPGCNCGVGRTFSAERGGCIDDPQCFVACTRDALQCPDGTWIGRTGPGCEFDCSNHQLPEGACLENADCQSDVCVFDEALCEDAGLPCPDLFYGFCAEDLPARSCEDTCQWSDDGECDDGGEGSVYSVCAYGTDCSDCGTR